MNIVDTFSGIGGFSLAAELASPQFKTTLFCEKDPYAQKVLKKNWPLVAVHDDICQLHLPMHSAHIITGGFPCQDISLLKSIHHEQQYLEGEKSGLWLEYVRLIREVVPRWVVVENVENLVKRGLGTVLSGLASLGYDAEWAVVPASSVGAEHKRNRCWVVAYHQSLGVEGLWPEGFQITRPVEGEELSVRSSDGQWKVEPDVRREVHGVSSKSHRLRCLGNAIVPQVAEQIFRRIAEIEGLTVYE